MCKTKNHQAGGFDLMKPDLSKFKKPRSKGILSAEQTDSEIVSERIMLYITPSEKAKLRTLAIKDGRKMSGLVRKVLQDNNFI